MPEDIEEPVVAKQDANAQEVMWIALFSDRRSTLELTEVAERQFKDRLQTLPGVGGVNLGGEKRQAIRVRLDAAQMAAHEITAGDLIRVFRDNSIELPSGRLENLQREISVRTLGKLDRPEQFEDLVIAYRNGGPVRLREIARVELGVEDERTVARYNQPSPSVGLGIVKQSEANALDVAEQVKAEVARIVPGLPKDIQVAVAYDSSVFVRRAITEVQETIVMAFVLVLLIMLAFLRNLRSTLIPMIAVPVSLIGTFLILHLSSGTASTSSPCSPSCSRSAWWWTMPSWCWRTSSGMSRRVCRSDGGGLEAGSGRSPPPSSPSPWPSSPSFSRSPSSPAPPASSSANSPSPRPAR
jgi:multidrug efflux pump